jgi:hypothetical protein
MKEIEQDEQTFVTENGHKVLLPKERKTRKRLEPKYIQIPRHWVTSLRQSKNAKAYELALIILWEVFSRGRYGEKEIVLSNRLVPGWYRSTKIRAARELEHLGLIDLSQKGKEALRVTHIYI